MALKLQQPGIQPLGQFDGYDGQYLTLKGGEVVYLTQVTKDVTSPDFDSAASDVFDGYVSNATNLRPVVKLLDVDDDGYMGMLADEGTAGYGTLFGVVVGGIAGQVTSGTVLGPHTATASGKVTCWDKPGLYAVTLDATEVAPTNPLWVGAPLKVRLDNADGTQGQLAFDIVTSGGTYSTSRFGSFVAFETNGSLVTTPKSLVSPLDAAKSVMVFQFDPWGH